MPTSRSYRCTLRSPTTCTSPASRTLFVRDLDLVAAVRFAWIMRWLVITPILVAQGQLQTWREGNTGLLRARVLGEKLNVGENTTHR